MAASQQHLHAASAAHAHCYAELPLADAYKISTDEQQRRGLDRNAENHDLTYGDVPFEAIATAIENIGPASSGCVFIDLGSGVARGVLAAALLHPFARCVGIEILNDLHDAAEGPVRRFRELLLQEPNDNSAARSFEGLDRKNIAAAVEIKCADLFEVDLAQLCREEGAQGAGEGEGGNTGVRGGGGGDDDSESAAASSSSSAPSAASVVLFICCVTWPPDLLRRVALKLARELPDGSSVCTVGQSLPHAVDLEKSPPPGGGKGAVQFEEAARFAAAFAWGAEVVVCARTVRLGTLAARKLRKQKGKLV